MERREAKVAKKANTTGSNLRRDDGCGSKSEGGCVVTGKSREGEKGEKGEGRRREKKKRNENSVHTEMSSVCWSVSQVQFNWRAASLIAVRWSTSWLEKSPYNSYSVVLSYSIQSKYMAPTRP